MDIQKHISAAGLLARQVVDALERADIHKDERHNVIVPGTLASVEDSISLLRRSIEETRRVTLYAGFTACPYICKFCRYSNKVFSPEIAAMIVTGLLDEIHMRNRMPYAPHSVSSLYIGGGTPALFSSEHLESVLSALGQYHGLRPDTEVTIETTPEIVSPGLIKRLTKELRPLGVSRISMGIQWLNDEWLASQGRKHSVEDVLFALGCLSDYASRFNVDLMYGFEGQTAEDLAHDIKAILDFAPDEITLYRLEDKKRTDDRPIRVQRQESEGVYALQAVGRLILEEAGYEEKPDGWFTRPGVSRAQVYKDRWEDQIPMAAYGTEAYSFSGTQQFTNAGFRDWIAALDDGHLPVDESRCFVYDEVQAAHRMMAFKLRSTFECPIMWEGRFFRRLHEAGLGTVNGPTFSLSKIGIMAVQEIVSRIISE